VVEKKMQAAIDALGEESGNLERVCSIGIDIYVVRNFIRIGSIVSVYRVKYCFNLYLCVSSVFMLLNKSIK